MSGAPLLWTERRLVIRSRQLAQRGAGPAGATDQGPSGGGGPDRTAPGQATADAAAALQEAVEAILRRYRVEGLLDVRYEDRGQERPVRHYGNRPARVQIEREAQVSTRVDREVVAAAVRRLGWRVYATTQPADQLSLAQAVLAYRSEYLIERDMGRLKGRPLSLTPMYLERDDHATGLIRLRRSGCAC